jgi:diguanylate cyclase (GGDEF)-like protein/PAS domain S-box-containing protein
LPHLKNPEPPTAVRRAYLPYCALPLMAALLAVALGWVQWPSALLLGLLAALALGAMLWLQHLRQTLRQTERRLQQTLTEREAFWSEIVRAMPDLLYVMDIRQSPRQLVFCNWEIGAGLGYSEEERRQMGTDFHAQTLHPDDRPRVMQLYRLQRKTGCATPLAYHARWRHRDGGWRWLSIREQAMGRAPSGQVERVIGMVKDVTEQIESTESLRHSERHHRLLAESISDVIYTTDAQLALNYVSSSCRSVLGYNPEHLIAHGFNGLVSEKRELQRIKQLLDNVRGCAGQGDALRALEPALDEVFIFNCLRADGQSIPVELRLMLMWDDKGRFEGLLGVGRDISQQRTAERNLRTAATVFEHSTVAILVADPAGYVVQINHAFSRISGYRAEQVVDHRSSLLLAPDQSIPPTSVLQHIVQHGSWEGEMRLRRPDGETYPAWVGITAVHDEEGDLLNYISFFSDISERKASEQHIHRLAYYDSLTQLPNRSLFQDRLHSALLQAGRNGQWLALIFLDLDRFKPINDSLGHAAGDRMLKEVAQRLKACVNPDDTVARMGGDEFTLLLQPRASRELALSQASQVAEGILTQLAQPFVLQGREFFVSASIGIALSPQDGSESSQLMKNADTAMYHAKGCGKNNFQLYQAQMNARALERLELENDLRHALEQDQLQLFYQPQYRARDGQLTGAEALLRWHHPARGLVPPGEFIPVLEELGLVSQVGDWVLLEACRQLKRWDQAGLRVPKVSVNLSARQFGQGQLEQRIASILHDSGTEPSRLELELTESILMRDVDEALRVLNDFKRLGVSIAIDDFGTGYSSLNYLKQFPINVLKIDRSFVDGLPSGEQDAQIARAIIAMAHSLNMSVIAEGVETQAQLDFLRLHQCDEAQGYLLGRPMPAEALATHLRGT